MKLPTPALLLILIVSNMLNYIDRGIIPGAANEITGFIEEALGPEASAETVSAWFGALVSAYIASYSVAAVVFGQMARSESRPLRLVGIGLIIWCFAAIACYLAQPPLGQEATFFQFVLLVIGRVLSGCGEAGFQCIVPGVIMAAAPPNRKALWMAALYTPIPVGTAAGYMIGAIAASRPMGWGGAYAIEAVIMLPIACMFCATDAPGSAVDIAAEEDRELLQPTERTHKIDEKSIADGSLWAGALAICSSLDFCLITLGYAAHTAVFAGLAAFGPTLVLGLGFFRGRETTASTAFGASVALGGMIGTPLGGWLSDRSAGKIAANGIADRDSASSSNDVSISGRQASLKSMIKMIGTAAVFAMFTVAAPNEQVFLPLISLVVCCAFGAQASITMAILSCVSSDLQALAMSLVTLGIHIFGDVPSPIIIGRIKGSLAPHCIVIPAAAAKDSNHTTSSALHLDPACANDRSGLRLTLAITVGYLFTAVMWWLCAYFSAMHKTRNRSLSGEDESYAHCPGSGRSG
jgi:MFS family permease